MECWLLLHSRVGGLSRTHILVTTPTDETFIVFHYYLCFLPFEAGATLLACRALRVFRGSKHPCPMARDPRYSAAAPCHEVFESALGRCCPQVPVDLVAGAAIAAMVHHSECTPLRHTDMPNGLN